MCPDLQQMLLHERLLIMQLLELVGIVGFAGCVGPVWALSRGLPSRTPSARLRPSSFRVELQLLRGGELSPFAKVVSGLPVLLAHHSVARK